MGNDDPTFSAIL